MTVREVVELVRNDLGNISVPVSQMTTIGVPIARAIDGLDAVLKAWDEEDKQKEEQSNPNEPKFSFDVIPEDDALVEGQNNG